MIAPDDVARFENLRYSPPPPAPDASHPPPPPPPIASIVFLELVQSVGTVHVLDAVAVRYTRHRPLPISDPDPHTVLAETFTGKESVVEKVRTSIKTIDRIFLATIF